MRRLGAALLLALMACTASPTPAPGRVPIEISINGVDGGKNARDVAWLRAMEPRLEAQLPEVDVVVRADGGSDESYKARMVLDLYGGSGSDLLSFDSFWTASMASAGLLAPLDEQLAGWDEWGEYLPSMQKMGEYEGHVYLVPFLTDVRGLYYRKDLFARAGLPVDWKPDSIEQIYAAGEALKKLPGVTPIQWDAGTSFGEATTMQGLYLPLLAYGGRLYADGHWVTGGPALERALEFYRQIYVQRELGDVALQLDPKGRERSFEEFRDGKIGIYPEGTYMWLGVLRPGETWGLADRDQLVGWAAMPGEHGPVSVSGGNGYILNKNSRHPRQAWQVLRLLASRPAQELRMQMAPFVPPRRDLLELPAIRQDAVLRDQLEQALPVTVFRPGLPLYPRVSERFQQATERVIQGQDPAAALRELQERLADLQ